MNHSQSLLSSSAFRSAKDGLLKSIEGAANEIRKHGVKPAPDSQAARDLYMKEIKEFSSERGRDLYFPFLSSGLGGGPFVELLDGSVKYDMITGIGINFFGHGYGPL